MSHFSFRPFNAGFDRHAPEPRRIEPGEWPRFEAALDAVNRDVAATLPNQQPLVLMLSPSWGEADLPDQIYVALSDGRWQGNAVHPQGAEECDLSEPDDAFYILALVADAAQETIVELLWQAWPVCPYHRIGMHPRPEGTTAYWDREWGGNGPVVWWCRGNHSGDCHDVSQVGALAAALPGKQRRALRRRERKRDRPR